MENTGPRGRQLRNGIKTNKEEQYLNYIFGDDDDLPDWVFAKIASEVRGFELEDKEINVNLAKRRNKLEQQIKQLEKDQIVEAQDPDTDSENKALTHRKYCLYLLNESLGDLEKGEAIQKEWAEKRATYKREQAERITWLEGEKALLEVLLADARKGREELLSGSLDHELYMDAAEMEAWLMGRLGRVVDRLILCLRFGTAFEGKPSWAELHHYG